MQRSSVDLPEPEAPISATAWCSRTSRSIPFSTSRSPKALVTPLTSRTGVDFGTGPMSTLGSPRLAHRTAPSGPPMRSTIRASGIVITR